ncbi:ABC transporter substrate-binding protein [Urechidicola sp. KH5]
MVLRNSICFLVLICVLWACSRPSSQFNDEQVFKYNEHSNITSLDPAFAKDISDIWAVNQLFNGLVQLNDNLEVQPAIAERWNISEDGKTYRFYLRDDVYYHKHELFGKDSTRVVIASDFEYAFNRLLDPKVASPGRWVLHNVAHFKAESDAVFTVVLKQPFPPFLGLMAMKYASVVPKEAVSYFGSNFRANPIGTGPFQFKLWVENTKLVFRKNPKYFEKDVDGKSLPYLEAVAITFLPDKQSEFLQFVQGELDFLNSIDPSYKDDILTPQGTLDMRYEHVVEMQKAPYLNTEYLGIYMPDTTAITKHHLIRSAMNYGFDRVKMMQFMRNGIGTPAIHGFIPQGLPSFNGMQGYQFQPEKAKALVAQFKEETGIANPSIAITTNSQYVDLCEYIQRQWQAIGLTVSVDVVPPSTLRQQKARGELPLFRASWVADYPDAENYLSLFYSKNFTPNGPNYTHFKNVQFDTWYEAAITETDVNKRIRIYQQMDSLVVKEAPVVPLYYDEVVRFTQKNVKGLGVNATNLLDLRMVKKH